MLPPQVSKPSPSGSSPSPQSKVEIINPDTTKDQKTFEHELQSLAAKAKSDTPLNWLRAQALIYARSATLLALLALASTLSQLALSPVYGSLPSARYHRHVLLSGMFVGWAGNLGLEAGLEKLGMKRMQCLLPLVIAYMPVVQHLLGGYSTLLGAAWGPVVTEVITFLPVVVLSVACCATWLDQADLGFVPLPGWVVDALPGIGAYAFFRGMEWLLGPALESVIGSGRFGGVVSSRVGMELVLSGVYAAVAPSSLLLWALPALLHTAFWNTHLPTSSALARVNGELAKEGFVVLDRRESVTGYVSVIDNLNEGYRVMRCDHSLLGGEWTKFIGVGPLKGNQVAEPVYAVFAMLEAVRLVEVERPVPDNEAKALVIGLGIGTTPATLVAHGINTTVVEIDPVVHDFAEKYFQLPPNHTAVIEDAVSYTSRLAADENGQRFDYIVHDVFTGGAEPIALFTLEFLQNLHKLLKPGGVIAINYAGDLALPPPRIVVRTIKTVFPSCRIFREHERNATEFAETGRDFTNMIMFCTKQADRAISFRPPTERDMLNSPSRQMFLYPRHEVGEGDLGEAEQGEGILRRNETEAIAKWHGMSAAGHWSIMRVVLPARVWELW